MVEGKPMTARQFFMANGGIKNKQTRELVMLLDSQSLSGTGFMLKIVKRGRVILQPTPYDKRGSYRKHVLAKLR